MIVVVGAGALGSHFVQFARNLGQPIKVIDFDRVEHKNVASQFHGKPHVSKSKVHALQQTMDFLFKAKISIAPQMLVPSNVDVLLAGASLVVDCLDNAPSRRVVQTYALEHDIPCLHGALAADGGYGRVMWSAVFAIDTESPGAATCEDGAHLPFIATVSSYLVRSAQIFLDTGKKVGFSVSPVGAVAI